MPGVHGIKGDGKKPPRLMPDVESVEKVFLGHFCEIRVQ